MISTENVSIARAAKILGIPYDNAKAINRTYQRENRIAKIDYQERYVSRRTNDVRFVRNYRIPDKTSIDLDNREISHRSVAPLTSSKKLFETQNIPKHVGEQSPSTQR